MKTFDDEQRPGLNQSLPWFPSGLPWWRRILCLLGYHRPHKWITGPKHKYAGMKLVNKCFFCNSATD